MIVCRDESYLLTIAGERIHVVFQVEAKPVDELRAYFQALLVLRDLNGMTTSPPQSNANSKGAAASPLPHQALLEATYRKMVGDFPLFLQQLENHGWRTHMYLLNTTSWRIKISERS